jgi:Fis family transcriptional regulator
MNFDGYFEKIQIQIEKVDSLEDLLVWRKRINIGHSGLSFRTEQGTLTSHCYRRFKDEEPQEADCN